MDGGRVPKGGWKEFFMNKKIIIPSEDEEQKAVFEWAALYEYRYPCLKMLYAIPNGGKRDIKTAKNLKKTGVKKGVPDICLPFPNGGYHGLYIELKRVKEGVLSPEQKNYLEYLNKVGYKAVRCKGWVEAVKEISRYLNEGKGNKDERSNKECIKEEKESFGVYEA